MRWQLLLVILTSSIQFGCVTAAGTGTRDTLRTQDGVCAKAGIVKPYITTCFRIGAPKTLRDDGTTPMVLSTVYASTLGYANPNEYQIEIVKDGRVVHKWRGNDSTPNFSVSQGITTWYGTDVQFLPEPFEDGVYTINWVAAYNTDIKASATITLRGVGDAPINTSTPTSGGQEKPCFEWQSDYEECRPK